MAEFPKLRGFLSSGDTRKLTHGRLQAQLSITLSQARGLDGSALFCWALRSFGTRLALIRRLQTRAPAECLTGIERRQY